MQCLHNHKPSYCNPTDTSFLLPSILNLDAPQTWLKSSLSSSSPPEEHLVAMKAEHVFLLCILGAALLSTVLCSNGIGPDDCCFRFYRRQMKKTIIRSYYLIDHRCPKPAVVLVTELNRRHICVDPNLLWVENMMRHLDEKDLK